MKMDSKLYEYSNEEVIRILVSAGSNIEAKNDVDWTPLVIACFNQDESVVKLLLDFGANPNAYYTEEEEQTVLDYAIVNGYTAIIRLLRKAKAKAGSELYHYSGFYPNLLITAVVNDDVELVKTLIAQNYDLNVQIRNGMTPLMIAAREDYANILKILLKAGADRTLRDDRGYTARDYTCFAIDISLWDDRWNIDD